jgi:hypothetical protein
LSQVIVVVAARGGFRTAGWSALAGDGNSANGEVVFEQCAMTVRLPNEQQRADVVADVKQFSKK